MHSCFLHLPRLVDDLFREAHIKSNGMVKYEEFTAMLTLPPVDYWFFKKENNYVTLQDNKLRWKTDSEYQERDIILHMKFGCIKFACWYSKGFSQWLFLEYFMINTQYNTLISFHNSPL